MAMQRSASQEILESDKEAFEELNSKPYAEQSMWMMNAFWTSLFEKDEAAREDVYMRTQLFIEMDKDNGKKGSSLDEFQMHVFLERLGETLTILKLRERMREVDLNFDKRVSPSEHFLSLYGKSVAELVRPQADPVEVQKAAAMVASAQASVADMNEKLEAQREALAEVKTAEAESRAAVEELKAAEDAHAAKIAELEKKSEEGGVVSRGRAKAELEQLKAEDPMPLRRAKITQEAALRKVEKARKAAETAEAEAAEAAAAAKKQLDEAEAYLADVSSRVGSSEGSIWFMQREIKEAQKYLPSGRKVKPSAA